MALSRWFCSNTTKSMFVKLVHPGGHIELHDRPVLASEIMLRNPRYVVAHPHVFRQPWGAVVGPDTTLNLGQKFYVVPISTIRKLHQHSSLSPSIPTILESQHDHEDHANRRCCFNVFSAGIDVKSDGDSIGSSGSFGLFAENKNVNRRRSNDHHHAIGSPKRRLSFEQWRPSLESITEE